MRVHAREGQKGYEHIFRTRTGRKNHGFHCSQCNQTTTSRVVRLQTFKSSLNLSSQSDRFSTSDQEIEKSKKLMTTEVHRLLPANPSTPHRTGTATACAAADQIAAHSWSPGCSDWALTMARQTTTTLMTRSAARWSASAASHRVLPFRCGRDVGGDARPRRPRWKI